MMRSIYCRIQPLDTVSFWQTQILRGIEAYAAEKRLHIEVISSDDISPGQWIMLIGPAEDWLIRESAYIREKGGYVLPVNATIPADMACHAYACFSMEAAVRDCVRYLASLGCTHPALVGLNAQSSADFVKRRIFLEESTRLGLHAIVEDIAPTPLSTSIRTFLSGSHAPMQPHGADGILCANDTTALLLIPELRKLHLEPSAAYPVIGMGNSFLGQRLLPSLTSVDFDYLTLGRQAARLYSYVSTSSEEIAAVHSVVLPCRLLIRQSTGNQNPAKELPLPIPNAPFVDYFHGAKTERILCLEDYLQRCDPIDRALILSSSESYRSISERLFISERAAKYRMSHILHALGLSSKAELYTHLSETLGISPESV